MHTAAAVLLIAASGIGVTVFPRSILIFLAFQGSLVFVYLQFVAMRLYEYPLMLACRIWVGVMIIFIALPLIVAWTSSGAGWHDEDGLFRSSW